jgi:hypothetical protein
MKSPNSSEARSLAASTLLWEARRLVTVDEDERVRREAVGALIERVSPLVARVREAIVCKLREKRRIEGSDEEGRGREEKVKQRHSLMSVEHGMNTTRFDTVYHTLSSVQRNLLVALPS